MSIFLKYERFGGIPNTGNNKLTPILITDMIEEYQTWKFQIFAKFENTKRKRRIPIVKSGEIKQVRTQAIRKSRRMT